MTPRLPIAFLVWLSVACSGSAQHLYTAEPWLAPGANIPLDAVLTGEANTSSESLVGLPALVETLLSTSPKVAAARERYRAAIERIPQATRIPDLMVEYAWLPLPVETRVGPNQHRLGLKQMVPFPTKLVARDATARAEARQAAIGFDVRVRDALTALKIAYADLYYFERALAVVEQNEALAATIAGLGATRSAQGQGLLFDVVRAQSQLAQLQYDQITLSERRDIALARINAILGRPADAPVQVEPLPLAVLEIDELTLLESALAHQQELRAYDAAIVAAEARLDAARSDWAPDITVGAQLMIQGDSASPTPPTDSGEEALAVTLGLSLPIWGWAHAGKTAEAEALLLAAVYDKKAHLASLHAELRDALFQERNAARLHILYDEELLPHARAALITAEQSAQGNSASFADLLEARAAFYSFTLARERAVADHFQAIARLEQLVGATLSPEEAP